MENKTNVEPDSTAVRVALWRALHVQVDPQPHVFDDELGLALVAPGAGWQRRPDMSTFTRPFRASAALAERYFSGRSDGLAPPSNGEQLLGTTT